MKTNIFSRLSILLFILLLILPTLLYFTIGENTAQTLEEKRSLAEFPDHFDENYFNNLESWYNDHAP